LRYSVLDDVVDPLTGGVLRVENAEIILRSDPTVRRCQHWYGRFGRPTIGQDCCACETDWIVAGEFVHVGDSSVRHPTVNGTPWLLLSTVEQSRNQVPSAHRWTALAKRPRSAEHFSE
jgi:hypothetical protein